MIITQAFRDAIFTNNIGLTTVDTHFNYVAFISSSRTPNDLDTLASLPTELDRILISSANLSYVGSRFKIDYTISTSDAVCATSIILAKDSTSSLITLTNATAVFFVVGNLIEIETSAGYIETSILAKTGDVITINSPINALIGGLVRKKITHIAVLCNAIGSINPVDLIFCFFPEKFFKDSSATKQIITSYELLGE